MKNAVFIIIGIFYSISGIGQNDKCDFETRHTCDTTELSTSTKRDYSHAVFEGKVISIDTVLLVEVLLPYLVERILNDTGLHASCSRLILQNMKILRVKIVLNEIFKGTFYDNQKETYLLTFLGDEDLGLLGYRHFELNKSFIVYAMRNPDYDDDFFQQRYDRKYFKVQLKYYYWTNRCKGTQPSNELDLRELREIDDYYKK